MTKHSISSVADLLEVLPKIYRKATGGHPKKVWFRGHANSEWKLIPSLSRCNELNRELELMKKFKQNAMQFLDKPPQTNYDWIFLMQHYAVPTRLLDWTEHPLVALYFATAPAEPPTDPCAATLWCLYPQELNKISGVILDPPDDIPAFGDEAELDDYLPERVRLGNSTKNPVAIITARQFARVYAQKGVFTIQHKQIVALDELKASNSQQPHLARINIPQKSVARLRRELAYLGFNKLTIFPQLENVALQVTEGIK